MEVRRLDVIMCNRLMDFLCREQLQSSSDRVFISVCTTDQNHKTDQTVENVSSQMSARENIWSSVTNEPKPNTHPAGGRASDPIVYMLFTYSCSDSAREAP